MIYIDPTAVIAAIAYVLGLAAGWFLCKLLTQDSV